MKDLRQALSEIHTIRNQVARGTEFRGYGPASIAVSGILAFLVAALQAQWMAKTARPDPATWLAAWAATAVVAVLLTGTETFARVRRVHVGLAREMLQSAVSQPTATRAALIAGSSLPSKASLPISAAARMSRTR